METTLSFWSFGVIVAVQFDSFKEMVNGPLSFMQVKFFLHFQNPACITDCMWRSGQLLPILTWLVKNFEQTFGLQLKITNDSAARSTVLRRVRKIFYRIIYCWVKLFIKTYDRLFVTNLNFCRYEVCFETCFKNKFCRDSRLLAKWFTTSSICRKLFATISDLGILTVSKKNLDSSLIQPSRKQI